MRLKIDENLPIDVVQVLASADLQVTTVQDEKLVGASDTEIASVCQAEEKILLTLDLDFADIRRYPPTAYPGIIVLRLRHQDRPHVLSVVQRLSRMLQEKAPRQQLWIVEEDKIRIRPTD